MSKRKKSRKRKTPIKITLPEESRGAEAATVMWMTIAMMTLLCLIGALATIIYNWVQPDSEVVDALSRVMLFTSATTGLLTLGFTVMVIKSRQTPPPRKITISVVVIATLSILLMVVHIL